MEYISQPDGSSRRTVVVGHSLPLHQRLTGLGKAIALDSNLPILAAPTTYAGSEMTPIYGITEARMERTGTNLKVLRRTVIYDPELTITLPIPMSITSGFNALAHAAEGSCCNMHWRTTRAQHPVQ